MNTDPEIKETKTLNIDSDSHKELKKAAAEIGCYLGDYAAAVIAVGLTKPEYVVAEPKRRAVAP